MSWMSFICGILYIYVALKLYLAFVTHRTVLFCFINLAAVIVMLHGVCLSNTLCNTLAIIENSPMYCVQ